MREIRQFYEELHKSYWKRDATSFGHVRGRIFSEWIGGGKRVLDLGSRIGEVAQHYREGNELICLDFDFDSLLLCRKSLKVGAVLQDLNYSLPFADASFDVVVAGEVLEHLFFPERLVSEACRLLKPGGMLMGSSPNAFYRSYRLKYLFGKLPDAIFNEWHIRPISFDLLKDILGRHFLRVELFPFRGKLNRLYPRLLAKMILFRAQKGGG